MYTLLISTTVILLLNLDSHQNRFSAQTYPQDFLIPMLLPIGLYKRTIVGPVTYVCVGICLLFALPLSALVYI